ncbi:MAG: hypothetical protein JWQ72_1502 [Polaromonas sp.]|nr:hypothetical protein [Polaromonas sp.]
MPTTHLLYLHGFRSSPRSAKAQKMAALMHADHPDVQWWCPQLPPSPAQAMADILEGIAGWPDTMAVMGSSLGGFYATWVAEQKNCRAVLLNPAVAPARDLRHHIGQQTAWHNPNETFFFQPEFVAQLEALHAGPLRSAQRCLAVIAKGDEVLDWREMASRYAGARLRLVEGSDHALSDFDAHLPAILEFLGLGR